MDRRDLSTSCALKVIREMPSVGSLSNASDAFSSVLISAVISSQIDG